MAAIWLARLATSSGRDRDGRATTAAGRSAQSQAARTLTTASTRSAGTGPSAARRGQQRAQPGTPAEVGQPGHDPARLGLGRGRDPAGQVDPELAHARRPHLPGRHLGAGPRAAAPRPPGRAGVGHGGGPGPAGAVVAPAARLRRRGSSSSRRRYSMRQAAGVEVAEHGPLLPGPLGGDPLVAVGVVGPVLAGRGPAAADPADRAVHVEHLEHHLEPAAGQVDPGLQRGGGQRPARVGQDGQRGPDDRLGRERERGEVGPDVGVLAAGQQR